MQDLQPMVQAVNGQSDNFGCILNLSKIKFMIVSRAKTPYANDTSSLNVQSVERVSILPDGS